MSAAAWISVGLGSLLGVGGVWSALDYRRICRRSDRERRMRNAEAGGDPESVRVIGGHRGPGGEE